MKVQTLDSDITLRVAESSDLPALFEICLKTGDSGSDASHLHNLKRLLGEIYVQPYVLFEPEHAYVLLKGQDPIGYLLGVVNTEKFEREMMLKYWPTICAKYDLNSADQTMADQELLRVLANLSQTDREITSIYPSHLHIDILGHYQGLGYGTKMIRYLISELRKAHSSGVHLQVSSINTGAQLFYKQLGFKEISRSSEDTVMGLLL